MAQIHMSSCYDPYPLTATYNYLGLKAEGAKDLGLVLGPWTRGERSLTYAGDVDFGEAATLDSQLAPDFIYFRADFFDRVSHGSAGQSDSAPVKVFIMGCRSNQRNNAGRLDHGGSWQGFADWPSPEVEVRSFYLVSDGQLASNVTPSASRIDYRFDPLKPGSTIGGAVSSGESVMRGETFDQH